MSSRYFRAEPCCDGNAPEFRDLLDDPSYGRFAGPLLPDEELAIAAVRGYGLTPQGIDRALPPLHSFADLPSVPLAGPGPGGLPNTAGAEEHTRRERARRVPMDGFRIVHDDQSGRHDVQILWCAHCAPGVFESIGEVFEDAFEGIVPFIRGIALVCSYIPVFGTAVAFVVNTSVSLAEGEDLDEALLDGIGTALPGQPLTGSAFTAIRSMINGDPFDAMVIGTLLSQVGLQRETRQVIESTIDVALAVARGEDLDDAALNALRDQAPGSVRDAVDLARRAAAGEDVGGALSGFARAAARNAAAQGPEDLNSYVGQAAFHGALESLPEEVAEAIKAGMAAGAIERGSYVEQGFVGTFGTRTERNVAANDAYFLRGQRIIASGARYGGMAIAKIRSLPSFSIRLERYDAITNHWTGEWAVTTYGSDEQPLDNAWWRGFIIALAVCSGSTERGPGQNAVHESMAEKGGTDGFTAGQAVAWSMNAATSPRVRQRAEANAGGAAAAARVAADERAGEARDRRLAAAPDHVVIDRPPIAAMGRVARGAGAGAGEPAAAPGIAVHDRIESPEAHGYADALLNGMRDLEATPVAREGFDAGVHVAGRDTAWGPGKQARLEALPLAQRQSAERAAHFVVLRNVHAELAARGKRVASIDDRPEPQSARFEEPAGYFTLGFDIAAALFAHKTAGGLGNTAPGPGSEAIWSSLPPDAMRGFDAATQLYRGE